MTDIKPVLIFKNVYKNYEKGENTIKSIHKVSLNLKPGTLTLVKGPSGSGKTTLIYLAGLLKKPSCGEIKIDGVSSKNLNENERAKIIREKIGIIYRRSNLLPNLTLEENVKLPQISGDSKKAQDLLENLGITNLNRFPNDLSFDQEQKVALARALSNNPLIILLDEPTGELTNEEALNFIKVLGQLENVAILMTSDHDFPHNLFDEIFELDDGKISSVYPNK